MSGLESIANAVGGPEAVECVRAHRQAADDYTYHGFVGDAARWVADLFDGVEVAQDTTRPRQEPKRGGRQIDSAAYSRLLFGVSEGDPKAEALYAACAVGRGDADAIEEYARTHS